MSAPEQGTSGYGPFAVIRYPTYYVVVDERDNNKIIHESRSRTACQSRAEKLWKALWKEKNND
jgi:hypothetical protein